MQIGVIRKLHMESANNRYALSEQTDTELEINLQTADLKVSVIH